MKTAVQLLNDSIQAYDNYKSIIANVAAANDVIDQLSQAAEQNAALGLFQASVNLNGIDVSSGNSVLFQRLLTDTLVGMGYTVTFSFNLVTTNILIDWAPKK